MTQPLLFDQPPPHTQRAPRQSHSPTSVAAAQAIEPHLGRLQTIVLNYIRNHGPITDNEIVAGLNGNASSIRPRRIELMRAGLVVQCGERNCSQTWKVKE